MDAAYVQEMERVCYHSLLLFIHAYQSEYHQVRLGDALGQKYTIIRVMGGGDIIPDGVWVQVLNFGICVTI